MHMYYTVDITDFNNSSINSKATYDDRLQAI